MNPENFQDTTVLIVDDEKHTREGLRRSFEDEFDVYVAANIGEAMQVLQNESVDVLVTDLRLGGEDGMDLIDRALKLPKPPVCIMMTAYGSVDIAVQAMKRGAYHYVGKPLNIDELELVIKRAVRSRSVEKENRQLKQQVEQHFGLENIIGNAGAMQPVFDVVRQVASTRATVLVEGESGTGKELVAHAIHNLSGRPKARLVIVHCAALSPQLLESELFGHERGAFTGATERRIGRFEEADGGTIFLDEIGEIDASTQVKLLRVLGERTFERVGGNKPIKVDVRVIAATNRHLEEMVAAGDFRDDLFFRLNVVKISMPPLRDRMEDLALMAHTFLKEFAKENGRQVREIPEETLRLLMAHRWPGNVRELRTAIEHGVIMCNGLKLLPKHLPTFLREEGALPLLPMKPGPGNERGRVEPEEEDLNLSRLESRLIARALERSRGNRTEAAKLLGISRRTMQRKLLDLEEGRGKTERH